MIPEDAIWILELIRNRDARTEAEKDAVNAAIEALKAQLSHEGATSELIDSVIKVLRSVQTTDRTDTGFVQNMTVRECIERVRELQTALNNQVNLCDSCTYTYPECPSKIDDVIFGNGIGNDNICACNKYQPTVQPVATDTNVGDKISKFIDGLEEIFADLRERHVDNSVCGLCEYDGAYMGQSGDWCNECPGFERDDCFKLSDKTRKEWTEEIIKALPPAQPEPKEGEWIPVHPLQGDDPGAYMCSKCKTGMWEIRPSAYHYCPNCGAHMRGEKDG